jgi:hypothetical protein
MTFFRPYALCAIHDLDQHLSDFDELERLHFDAGFAWQLAAWKVRRKFDRSDVINEWRLIEQGKDPRGEDVAPNGQPCLLREASGSGSKKSSIASRIISSIPSSFWSALARRTF